MLVKYENYLSAYMERVMIRIFYSAGEMIIIDNYGP
jgi:hypothetical protein